VPVNIGGMPGWDWLAELFELPGEVRERLARHWELVRERPEAGRLTAVEGEEAVRRHYAESLELLRLAEGQLAGRTAVRFADVAPGAAGRGWWWRLHGRRGRCTWWSRCRSGRGSSKWRHRSWGA